MTTISQLLTLIEMSGLGGDAQIALRVGETIVPMESCTFHEMKDGTALMIQGGRLQREPALTRSRVAPSAEVGADPCSEMETSPARGYCPVHNAPCGYGGHCNACPEMNR